MSVPCVLFMFSWKISTLRLFIIFLLCNRLCPSSQNLHSTKVREMSHRYINIGPHRLFFLVSSWLLNFLYLAKAQLFKNAQCFAKEESLAWLGMEVTEQQLSLLDWHVLSNSPQPQPLTQCRLVCIHWTRSCLCSSPAGPWDVWDYDLFWFMFQD